MANISLAVAASHAPGLIGMFDQAPAASQTMVTSAYGSLTRQIREAELDVLLMVANDHMANNRIREYPDFVVGMAPEHSGPAEFFKDWLGCGEYAVPGRPDIAEKILNGLNRRGVAVSATRENLNFDDNISVPVVKTGIEAAGVPIVPILQNVTVPPFPDQHRCYEIGRQLADLIENDLPSDLRVGLFATGGMSHEPGGVRDFWIDEDFDNWFLGLLGNGNHEQVLSEVTLERLDQAGIGGTGELLSWILVMGAIGERPCDVLGYTAWDKWRCGIGAVSWDMTPAPAGR
ncbi:DODA-type extradiol aromatic ring-opening family dioxygenase [Streptomyces sp. NPDC055060]